MSASYLLIGCFPCASAIDSHLRLTWLLLLTRSKSLPLASILSLRFGLNPPYNFIIAFLALHLDLFAISNNHISLSTSSRLLEDNAISSLQRRNDEAIEEATYHVLSRLPSLLSTSLAFLMRFPRGYGGMKKVMTWMKEFHQPYEDALGSTLRAISMIRGMLRVATKSGEVVDGGVRVTSHYYSALLDQVLRDVSRGAKATIFITKGPYTDLDHHRARR
ncbi:hypothetical protein GUJ93_ZPchr0004g40115 [Zizania palustris]|uniref:PORR domain-containing protein n=1 Tax=Zizania palustris TaxID=103762 RepID=A0A8J5SMM2_ZIZPA|nr:hypothetical protein GUJ93_ZPchr0004g40115 [Zizania palustris]